MKPLKRFPVTMATFSTGLKPGVNEKTFEASLNRQITTENLVSIYFSVDCTSAIHLRADAVTLFISRVFPRAIAARIESR